MRAECRAAISCDRRRAALAALVLLSALLPVQVAGQGQLRPGEERPELPAFPEPAEPPLRLPPAPVPPPPEEGDLYPAERVFVAGFRVVGSSVFDEAELAALLAPYSGRAITSEELLAARDRVTSHYVEHGYITSGAVLPDQRLEQGVVTIEVVEGVLADVEVAGSSRFRPGYFRDRVRLASRPPLDVRSLERLLQRFQRDPRIESIHAVLSPGMRRGESVLTLSLVERPPYGLGVEVSNEEPPSIGSDGGGPLLRLENALGLGDSFELVGHVTEGLRELDASYALPIDARDTIVDLRFRASESRVVTSDVDSLDLVSDSVGYDAGLRHPIYRDSAQELWLGATFSWHRSQTYIFEDEEISLAPGADDGETVVSALRLFQEWTLRSREQVVAARWTLSLGLDVLGASMEPGQPNGEFVAWLGQLQWARRLPERFLGAELLARADVQLADDRLLSLEKFAVGGLRTVRGYHENELVRDAAAVFSLEVRVPVLADSLGRPVLQIASFFDVGRSWDKGGTFGEAGGDESLKTLSSPGLGLLWSPTPRVVSELYWGVALRDVDDRGSGLQNLGIHYRVVALSW